MDFLTINYFVKYSLRNVPYRVLFIYPTNSFIIYLKWKEMIVFFFLLLVLSVIVVLARW